MVSRRGRSFSRSRARLEPTKPAPPTIRTFVPRKSFIAAPPVSFPRPSAPSDGYRSRSRRVRRTRRACAGSSRGSYTAASSQTRSMVCEGSSTTAGTSSAPGSTSSTGSSSVMPRCSTTMSKISFTV